MIFFDIIANSKKTSANNQQKNDCNGRFFIFENSIANANDNWYHL